MFLNRTERFLSSIHRCRTIEFSAIAIVVIAGMLSSASVVAQEKPPASLKIEKAYPSADAKISADEQGSVPPSSACLEAPSKEDRAYRFNAGSFSAQIVQVTSSMQGNYSVIRLNLLFKNLTKHSLTLDYRGRTSILADDLGNTYFGAKAGNGPDTSATGIGTDIDSNVDTQFTLQPNQCDSATFQVWGSRGERQCLPAFFHYDVTIDEVDIENPGKIPRQHALYFGDFTTKSRNPAQRNPHGEDRKADNRE